MPQKKLKALLVDLIVELFERTHDEFNIVPAFVDEPLGRPMDGSDQLLRIRLARGNPPRGLLDLPLIVPDMFAIIIILGAKPLLRPLTRCQRDQKPDQILPAGGNMPLNTGASTSRIDEFLFQAKDVPNDGVRRFMNSPKDFEQLGLLRPPCAARTGESTPTPGAARRTSGPRTIGVPASEALDPARDTYAARPISRDPYVGAAVGSAVRLCSIVSAFPLPCFSAETAFRKQPGNALMNERNPMLARVYPV